MLKRSRISLEENNSSPDFNDLISANKSPVFAISNFLPIRDKVRFFSANKATRSLYNAQDSSNKIWERAFSLFPCAEWVVSEHTHDIWGNKVYDPNMRKVLQRYFEITINSGHGYADKHALRQWLFLNDEATMDNVSIPENLMNLIKISGLKVFSEPIDTFELLSYLGFTKLLKNYVSQKGLEGDKLRDQLQKDRCASFEYAAKQGNLEVLHQLWEWAGNDASLQRKMLTAEAFEKFPEFLYCSAFWFTAFSGHLNILQQFWIWAEEHEGVRELLLTARSCQAFTFASQRGWVEIVQQLWIWAGEYEGVRRQLLAASKSEAFTNASEMGHLNIVQLLLTWAGDYEGLRYELMTAKECEAFTSAAQNGKLDIVRYLWNCAGEDINLKMKFLTSQDYKAFRDDVGNLFMMTLTINRLQMLRQLCSWLGEYTHLKPEILTVHECEIFRLAVSSDDLSVVRELWSWAGDDANLKQQLLTADNCGAFRLAGLWKELPIFRQLWEWIGDDIELKNIVRIAVTAKCKQDIVDFMEDLIQEDLSSQSDTAMRMV